VAAPLVLNRATGTRKAVKQRRWDDRTAGLDRYARWRANVALLPNVAVDAWRPVWPEHRDLDGATSDSELRAGLETKSIPWWVGPP